VTADPAALTSVFNERAQALDQQLLVTFTAPYGSGEDAYIDVVVDAGGTQFHDTAFATLGPGFEVPDVVESGKALIGDNGMLLGAAALAVGLFGLLAIALARIAHRASSLCGGGVFGVRRGYPSFESPL